MKALLEHVSSETAFWVRWWIVADRVSWFSLGMATAAAIIYAAIKLWPMCAQL